MSDVQERSSAEWEQAARTIALRRLAAAPRSCAQIRESLTERGVPPVITEHVIERFTEVGLLDDQAFARSWVLSRSQSRGLARSALRRELLAKGVDTDLIDVALAQVDDEAELRRAMDVASRRASHLRGESRGTAVRRLSAYLMRRGYSPAVAGKVSREALEAG